MEATSSQPPKKRIILHVGAQKTGSTSLQNQIQARVPQLQAEGYFYAQRLVSKGDIHPFHWASVRIRREDDPDTYVKKGQDIIANTFRKTGAHTLLVSNESLLGEPLWRDERSQLYQQVDFAAEKLAEMCRGYDIQVFFVARDWAQFLPSYYAQAVRQGATDSFEDWSSDFDFQSADWRRHVRALITAFGADRVHVAFLEDPLPSQVIAEFGDKPSYYQRFAHAANLPQQQIASVAKNQNTSPGKAALYVMRLLNKLMYRRGESRRMRFLRRHILHKIAIKLLPKRHPGPKLANQADYQRAYQQQKAEIKAMPIKSW